LSGSEKIPNKECHQIIQLQPVTFHTHTYINEGLQGAAFFDLEKQMHT